MNKGDLIDAVTKIVGKKKPTGEVVNSPKSRCYKILSLFITG